MRSKALNETQPIAMPMAEVAGSTGDWDPCMTDRIRIVGVGFDDAEPDTLAIIVTEHPEDLHEYAAVRIREHTYWDAFCDLWAMPDDVDFTPLETGYVGRLCDAQRIRRDFDRALAKLGVLKATAGATRAS